ncbi:MAG: anthranilate phosphoribosyltransferase [Candidatus Micrarchaeales archaeon]|jgi:anthranilate phosphoribosyltransferase
MQTESEEVRYAIARLADGRPLSFEEARILMTHITEGALTDVQLGAILMAFRIRGETPEEIAGFASVMKEKSQIIKPSAGEKLVDIVGTGGAALKTVNISTMSSFVVAGAGIPVAKHGNRSVTSKSGSADLIEALGAKLTLTPEQVKAVIDEVGFGFLFAQTFHPAMKYVAGPRKELGIRTIFNLLGPLTNPAGVKYIVLGVYEEKLVDKIALVVQLLGYKRALVVYGAGGLDELSTLGETFVAEVDSGKMKSYTLTPEELGFKRSTQEEIAGSDPQESAKTCTEILKGKEGAVRDIVLLNAGAAIYAARVAESIKEGIEIARRSIDSGAAYKKMEEFVRATNRVG